MVSCVRPPSKRRADGLLLRLRTSLPLLLFFFFNDTATTEIYTLSLHDALPICRGQATGVARAPTRLPAGRGPQLDRKSTRLNSSHGYISYAVFCLKKKKISNIFTAAVFVTAWNSLLGGYVTLSA